MSTTNGSPASPSAPTKPTLLLKLSGEAFCAPGGSGIDPQELALMAQEIHKATKAGARLAIVVGGGNFVRGATLAKHAHVHQANADYMGMLATVMNGVALKDALAHAGVDSRVMSAIDIRAVSEPFIRGRALRHLDKGRIVILVAGAGNPFCTTDTAAALRAIELECDLLLKATKVDGVYTADPKTNPDATRYNSLTFSEAINKGLGVMDMTAITMCNEHNVPVLVFDFKVPGNIEKVVRGETLGTRIEVG